MKKRNIFLETSISYVSLFPYFIVFVLVNYNNPGSKVTHLQFL